MYKAKIQFLKILLSNCEMILTNRSYTVTIDLLCKFKKQIPKRVKLIGIFCV